MFSGAAGIETALAGEYDTVIVDYGLPDIDGVEIARRIRGERPAMRVILATGYPASDPVVAGVGEVGIAILTKPVDPAELSARVAVDGEGRES